MSEFRIWLIRMWYEHQKELEYYNQSVPYNSAGYFRKYKYWLKREYQYRRKQNES